MPFFAAPPRIGTEASTRLPDRFRRPRSTEWARWNRGGREIDSFLEGPCFDTGGRLYVTDIPFGRIFRISPDSECSLVAEYDGWPNGLKVAADGDRTVTKAGIFIRLHGGPGGPDGLAWDLDGNLLVAHTGVGTVWRFSARAEPTLAITSCAGASTTNFCLGGADGRDLFITGSETGSVLRARSEFGLNGAVGPEATMVEKGKRRPALEGVASADRALTVLSAFRKGDRALSLAELAERTGLVKSTIMRLAISLETHGYLARGDDGAYRLDAEVLRLGTIYTQSFRLDAHVIPVLEELVARTGETAAFYVRRGEQRLCLYRVDSPHLLRMHVRVGDALPLDSSAIAQVLRAFAPRPLPLYVATLDLPIVTMGATDPHTGAMAAPVFGPGDKLAGSLALSAPVIRWTPDAQAAARPILAEAAAALTRRIGGEMPERPGVAAE